jgi:hypothetical protein
VATETPTATATPTESDPPSVDEDPSATALPSVLADERTVTVPPVDVTVTPERMAAVDEVLITLIASAAATVIGPEEDEADGGVPELAVLLPVLRVS